MLKGLLSTVEATPVNEVSAPGIARDRGIAVREERAAGHQDYASLVTVVVGGAGGEAVVAGTVFGHRDARIVRVNQFRLEAVPEGNIILCVNDDSPGVVGNIGTALGAAGVNIARISLSRDDAGAAAVVPPQRGLRAVAGGARRAPGPAARPRRPAHPAVESGSMLDLSLPLGLRDLTPDHSAHLADLSARLHEVFAVLRLPPRSSCRRWSGSRWWSGGSRRRRSPRCSSSSSPARARWWPSGPTSRRRSSGSTRRAPTRCPTRRGSATTARCCGPARPGPGGPREVYQAGVELLGAGGPSADAEALVGPAQGARPGRARRRRASRWGTPASPARCSRRPASAAAARAEAEEALSRKDEGALTRLAGQGQGRARRPARRCPSLAAPLRRGGAVRGPARFAQGVPGAAAPLAELEAALRLARRRGVREVEVDLGEVRGLGYYTGITFAGYAPGAGSAVASGGRYDGLLARFGRPGPAIGFARRPRVRHPGAGAAGPAAGTRR